MAYHTLFLLMKKTQKSLKGLNQISDSKSISNLTEIIEDCVHCGLCLSSCPTYLTSGLEAKSPRGRLMIMNQIQNNPKQIDEEMLYHLDTCLDCRGCETVCPSGVEYHSAFHETNKIIISNSEEAS